MIRYFILLLVPLFISFSTPAQTSPYIANKPPLKAQPYIPLPLGAIKAKGWLRQMLELQRNGLTGKLDAVYPEVCGPTNAWLGSEGDAWERGPVLAGRVGAARLPA